MASLVPKALSDYQEVLDAVFPEEQGGVHLLAEREHREPDGRAVDQLIEKSDNLRTAIVASLDTRDPQQRDLASLQLTAAAALDIDSANRLVQKALLAQRGSGAAGLEGFNIIATPALSLGGLLSADDHAQLAEILSTPTETASRILGESMLNLRPLLFAQPPVDTAAFKTDAGAAIDGIVSDSSGVASKALKGLLGLPKDEVLVAIAKPVVGAIDDLLGARLHLWVKKAAKLVAQGIEKLLALFGTKASEVLTKVGDWVKKLEDDSAMSALFTRIFLVDALKTYVGNEIDTKGGAAAPQRVETAESELANLAGRLHKQMDILSKVEWVLGHASKWVVGAAKPYGLIVMVAANSLVAGYAVYAAQDYLDRSEGGILDHVVGVRRIVDASLLG